MGDKVKKGEALYRVHAEFNADFQFAKSLCDTNNGYQIGDEKATVALKEAAANDKNKTVRRVVSAMVQKLESVELAHK